jgi:hypothetical protein
MVDRAHLAAPRNFAAAAGMNPDRWQQVKHALDSVLGLQSADRSPYLKELSSSDPELHREVESLLRSHEQVDSSFLRAPALALLPDFEGPQPVRTGRRMGAYHILEEIGRGGMGEVYRAVRADGEFDREVAVKLVRGGLDTQFVLERFRHERQILAGPPPAKPARALPRNCSAASAATWTTLCSRRCARSRNGAMHPPSSSLMTFAAICKVCRSARGRTPGHIAPENLFAAIQRSLLPP